MAKKTCPSCKGTGERVRTDSRRTRLRVSSVAARVKSRSAYNDSGARNWPTA